MRTTSCEEGNTLSILGSFDSWFSLACEQAHLFGEFVRDNLGGESRDLRGDERSEPARGMGRGIVSLHESSLPRSRF